MALPPIKQKPFTLIVSNVDQPLQCIKRDSEKKGREGSLLPSQCLQTTHSWQHPHFQCILLYFIMSYFFIWQVFLWLSGNPSVLDFTLGNFFRYSASFSPLYFFSTYCQYPNQFLAFSSVSIHPSNLRRWSFLPILVSSLSLFETTMKGLVNRFPPSQYFNRLWCYCLNSIQLVSILLARNWNQRFRWDRSRIAEKNSEGLFGMPTLFRVLSPSKEIWMRTEHLSFLTFS